MSIQRQAPRTPDRPGRSFLDFSPKHINDYQRCPEFFYWRHIKRQWTRKPFSRALVIGQAAHNALAFIWNQRLDGFETPDDLLRLSSLHLNQSKYPFEEKELWPEDVAAVAGHVERCLAALDGELSVISVEREWSHKLARANVGPPLRIQSRVDLVVRREDGTVEHVDYKTGKRRPDPNQEVMSRVVVRAMLSARQFGDPPLVTTTLYSSDGTKVSEQLTRKDCLPVWSGILDAVTAIRETEGWKPAPGHYCSWCDFRERCSVRGET